MNKKIPKIDKKTIAILCAAFVLLIPIIYAGWFNLKYRDTAFPGVALNDRGYTGLSWADTKILFEGNIAYMYKDGMKLTYQDKVFNVALAELGYSIDTDKSIGQVYSYGKKQDLALSIREQINLIDTTIIFQNQIDRKDFLIEANRWRELAALETPAQDFSYKYNKGAFVSVEATEGFVINQDKLRADIENNLLNSKNDTIALEMIKDTPSVIEDKDGNALAQAKNLLDREVVLKYDTGSRKMDAEDFGSWIGFAAKESNDEHHVLSPAPDMDEIKDYLVSLVPQVNREPVNAQLEFKDGKVQVFSLSQEGIAIDTDQSANKIGEKIFQEENYTEIQKNSVINAAPVSITVELDVNSIAPELSTDNIDNMGVTSLLATGESNFRGSTKSRIHNVTVGAGKFNGALVGPGDTFSFNSILGNVGAKEGYLPELVIKQGQTIAEYGGGLCQVSTTAFRAAVSAGMEITERKNHAYAVSYYSPQGTDATIYPPHPDLAFINNTPNYILIQTRISGTILTFDFYGTDDGRKVETEGPVVYERGEGGAMKTWWGQKVYDKDGNLFLEKVFYSNYKSPALYPHTNPLE
ncbi:MAG: VanW family protein [Candidatus Pacebacteria bacterium]|nr:VanW family protein [Candidatus Paceibacterota bacterium]